MTSQHVRDLIVQHRGWALPLAFIVPFAESFALVSLVVPGSVIMAAVGALVGSGQVAFWPLLLGAVPGAVMGDAISYWLGQHHGDRIQRVWPFSRHPALLAKGLAFAGRHGGKSVFLGRFFGPVRAVVPLAAGMLALQPARFWAANVGSALLWAPIVLAPGTLGGAGLGRLFEASLTGHGWPTLAAILVLVLAAGFLGVRLLRRHRWRQPASNISPDPDQRVRPVLLRPAPSGSNR